MSISFNVVLKLSPETEDVGYRSITQFMLPRLSAMHVILFDFLRIKGKLFTLFKNFLKLENKRTQVSMNQFKNSFLRKLICKKNI